MTGRGSCTQLPRPAPGTGRADGSAAPRHHGAMGSESALEPEVGAACAVAGK